MFSSCLSLKEHPHRLIGINELIDRLATVRFDVSYDKLDMFLWHLGKFYRGNFSLVFTMKELQKFELKYDPKGTDDRYGVNEMNRTLDLLNKVKGARKHYDPIIELAEAFLKEDIRKRKDY